MRLDGLKKQMGTLNRFVMAGSLAGVVVLAGCRQDMHDQPKFIPQRSTTFFADGRSARPQVDETVARGQLHENTYFNTGMISGKEGDSLPFAVTPELLERGQERYNVYCTPCHSRVGNGLGEIVQRGYRQAGNFNTERLRTVGLGHFFNVMTNGYGAMPDYAAQLTPADRWAVSAYIRALQLSQHATQGDVPSGAEVKPIEKISEDVGLPAKFADEWDTPSTAVSSVTTNTETTTPATGGPNTAPTATTAAPTTPATSAPPAPGSKAATDKTASAATTTPTAGGDAKAGKTIYTANCQVCHQPTMAGLPPNIPSLVGVVGRTSAGHVRGQVLNGYAAGVPPMPSFKGKLSSADIDNLIAYLTDPSKAK